MPYPTATGADVEFFEAHGWLVVEDAIDVADLDALEAACAVILERKETMAFDWAWEEGTPKEQRAFKIVQSSPSLFFPELNDAVYRRWAVEFASALMRRPLEFWYEQFLAKPPGNSAPTRWHQDEGYWGRNLDDAGITCWMPMHDVDESNGCMHFVDGGHRDGVLEHALVPGVQSDLLACAPDETRAVACPLRAGGVTFHHSKTPHMTTANNSDSWRRALTQHLRVVGSEGEGDHYPWKIYVNQITGERIVPSTR
jgi:ectoine hydroxylase-related dioxygenase (phytanoyl-CoA dioxygenase family)